MRSPIVFFVLSAFFLGAVPNAYLAGRFLKNIDIRQHGSGNIGATNVFRILGKGPGIVVFSLDFLKGALPVVIFMFVLPHSSHQQLFAFSIGLAAMLGHMFTPFLRFKGGKGIATGSGAVCACFPLLFAIALAVWLLSFLLSRIVSVSSILAVCALLLSALLTRQSREILFVFFAMLILVLYSHRGNIKRLWRGEEKRIG